jgi:hypothetical protein
MVSRNRGAVALAQKPKVRGRPFQPGNPGRPLGSKNKTTRLVEQLIEGDGEKLGRKMIGLAKQGDVRCLKYCLDHLLPKRSGRPLDFELPSINSVQDLIGAMSKVSIAVNNGELTAEEAAQIVHLLEGYGNIFTIYDIAARLETLERQMKEKGDDLTSSQRVTKFGMGSTD